MITLFKKIYVTLKLHGLMIGYFLMNKKIIIALLPQKISDIAASKINSKATVYAAISRYKLNRKIWIYSIKNNSVFDQYMQKKLFTLAAKYKILKKIIIQLDPTQGIRSTPSQLLLTHLVNLLNNRLQLYWLISLNTLPGYEDLPTHVRFHPQAEMTFTDVSAWLINSEKNPHLQKILYWIEQSEPDKNTKNHFQQLWSYFYNSFKQYENLYQLSTAYATGKQYACRFNRALTKDDLLSIANHTLTSDALYSRRERILRICGIIAPLLLFSGLSSHSFYANHQGLKRVWLTENKLMSFPASANFYTYKQSFPNTIWMHFGLFQGNKLFSVLQTWYVKSINNFYLPQLTLLTKNHLQTCLNTRCGQALTWFKMYMMLVKPHYFNAAEFTKNLSFQDKSLFEPGTLPSALTFMQQFGFKAIAHDEELDNEIINYLPTLDAEATRFIQLEETNLGLLHPFTSQLYLKNSPYLTIPLFYTKSGYAFYLTFKERILRNAATTLWYYPASNINFERQLSVALDTAYINRYVMNWTHLINKIQINPIGNLLDEVSTLHLIIKNPFVEILKIIDDYAFIADKSMNVSQVINAKFYSLHTLANSQSLQMTLNTNFSALTTLLSKLAAEQPRALLTFMRAAESNGSITELSDLQRTNQQLPALLQPVLSNLITQTSQNLFNQLLPSLNTQWQHLIPAINQLLKTTYPFSPTAQQDSTVAQWQQLLGSNSELILYLQQNIAPFINLTDGTPYKLYGANLALPNKTLLNLVNFHTLNQAFFAGNSFIINFSLQPVHLASVIPKISLTLLDQLLIYQHGPLLKTHYQFSATTASTTSQMTWFSFSQENTQEQQSGLWSWLRMLSHAQLSALNDHTWQVKFSKNNATFVLILQSNQAMNLLLNGKMQGITLPGSLL